MENQDRIAIKTCFKLLLDREWHDIYELHKVYRLLPSRILKTLNFLSMNGIIIVDDDNIKLADNISNYQLANINNIFKTEKPECLTKSHLEINH